MFSLSSLGRRGSTKVLTGTVALALASTVVGITGPAFASLPASPVQGFIETSGFTADPANAISSGWWGHEGAGKTGTSYFSLDGKGSASTVDATSLAAQLAKIGPDATVDNVHVAFVLTSADGSAERPAVTAGETVGQAFTWFDASSIGGGLAGNTTDHDYVDALSTDASYNAWFNAGQPVYGFDANLKAVDATGTPCTYTVGSTTCGTTGAPLSGAHAIGTSILNTWASGTNVSLVYYVSTANNANNEPIVTVGPDGHAETAWMPFTTVGMPSDHSRDPIGSSFPSSFDSLRTSAGYVAAGAAVAPTVHIADSWVGTSGTLTASLTNASNVALTNASGSIQFMARPVDASGGSFSAVGSPVTVSATGTATMPISGLAGGHFQMFEAVYTPDSAASSLYTGATSGIDQAFGRSATTTTLGVGGTLRYPYKQTLTATVGSGGGIPTGTVTFLDKGVSIGSVALNSTGHASLVKGLSIGTHLISVRYNGAGGFATSASAARSVVIAKDAPAIYPVLSPIASRVIHGTRPHLTVTVKAYGLTPTGTVTLVILAPNHRYTTLRGTLRYGKVVFTLPAVLRGTTRITIKYSGSTTVLAGTKLYSFAVTH